MPWVRLDDRFPSHRKVALLSDRAFRLYVSALCWSSENLTEGRILEKELPLIARVRGPKAVVAELEAAGLWDRTEVGWAIHDYLEYNPDRARVKSDREANAARQKAFRDRKKAEREAKRNGDRNGVTPPPENAPNDTADARRRHDGDTNAQRTGAENQSSPQVNEIRNGVSNGTPSPSPSQVPPTEELPPPPPSSNHSSDVVPANSGRGEIQPLIDAMIARGMNVTWTFHGSEWVDLRDAVRRVGINDLVDYAARSWQAARDKPHSARYFIRGWIGLQAAGPSSTPPPSKGQSYLAQMAAHAERLRDQTGGA